ncbi:hypothetical protein AAFX91_35385 [Bradyrhizobium sp. 31Argb]|uniref:hypothetical protein n=1 Tax=unclassified Bradyrhizobium TaxID=2631580 RepID=UPI00102E8E44|nr:MULTISPECIES: hypothetical protein [unclassified Bradyrhizobium]MDI4232727.1 hypothetical protein [Bradyrhizobium sp. Arg237L]TAI66717.1 hypothetical protein CWO89_06595 [Bradyrhizobium sp. Leo170]
MNELAIDRRSASRANICVWVVVVCGVIAVLAANTHLIYVASTSQPACVSHLRQGDARDAPDLYYAAKSSCSPPAIRTSAEGHER